MSPSSKALVQYEVKGQVAFLTMNRPEKRNAVNAELASMMEAALDAMESDDAVRVGILRAVAPGDRPVFCAGHDLTSVDHHGGHTERGGLAGLTRRARSKPLIAAVNGLAVAGGCELVLACDIVVASDCAAFALAEVKWNLIASSGGLFRLARIVGRPVAMDMLLTAQEISAERAYQLGMISRLCRPDELDEVSMEVADAICMNGPQSVRVSREIAARAEYIDDSEGWRLVADAHPAIYASEDLREGLSAFAERRLPQWKDR